MKTGDVDSVDNLRSNSQQGNNNKTLIDEESELSKIWTHRCHPLLTMKSNSTISQSSSKKGIFPHLHKSQHNDLGDSHISRPTRYSMRRSSDFKHLGLHKEKKIARSNSCNETQKEKKLTDIPASPQNMRSALNYSSQSLDKIVGSQRLSDKMKTMQMFYAKPRHRARSRDSSPKVDMLWLTTQWEKEMQINNARRALALQQNRRELKLLEEKYKRDVEENEILLTKEKEIQKKEEKHRKLHEEACKKLAERLAYQHDSMKEKREKLSENLKMQQEQLEQYHKDLVSQSREGIHRAEREKLRLDILEQERKKMLNLIKEREFTRRRLHLNVENRVEIEELRRYLQERDSQVNKNQENVKKSKKCSLEKNQQESKRKASQSAERRKNMQEESQKYHQTLLSHQESILQKAVKKVEEKNVEKQERLREERANRFKLWKTNYDYLAALENDWLEEEADILQYKEEKVKKLQLEMQSRMHEARALAKAAEQLRDDIRKAYNLDSFDKKVLRAKQNK